MNGYGASIGLDGKGRLFAWGKHYGADPVALPDVGKTFTQVVTSSDTQGPECDHFLALSSDGEVYAWGGNQSGQLGQGTTSNTWTERPTKVLGLDSTRVVQVASSWDTSAAVTADGAVYTWGANIAGALGTGTSEAFATLPNQVNGVAKVVELSGGGRSFLARTSDDEVYSWGYDYSSRPLAYPWEYTSAAPVRISALSGKKILQVAAGGGFAVALGADGTVWTWGNNERDQLALGFKTSWYPTPYASPLLSGKGIVKVGLGLDHGLAITSDHHVLGWGSNLSTQLGTGPEELSVPAPLTIPTFDGMLVKDVVAGCQSSTVILGDGRTYQFGSLFGAGPFGYAQRVPLLVKSPQ